MIKQDGGITLDDGGPDVETMLNRALDCLQQGRRQEASDLLNQVLEAAPINPEAHHLTGLLYQQQGMFTEARVFLERAAKWAPENPTYQLNLGVTLADLGETEAAIGRFRTALDLQPEYAFAYGSLGFSLAHKGDFKAALETFEKATALKPDYPQAQRGLVEVLGRVLTDTHQPDVEAALVRAFQSTLSDYADLAPAAARQLELKYVLPKGGEGGEGGERREGREDIHADDGLLAAYLTKCINISIPLEVILTGLRRHLILAGADALGGKDQALAGLVARQCFLNEYVWHREADEENAARTLAHTMEEALAEISDSDIDAIGPALLLCAMYGPLSGLAGASVLANLSADELGEPLEPIVQMTVRDHLQEARLKDAVPTIGAITDATSVAVRGLYEENPYPRWSHAPNRVQAPLAVNLRRTFPHFTPPDFLGAPLTVLIAGCGTGQHVVNVAARMPPGSRITAIDLSKASLAYAMRMTQKLGVKNTTFLQADILDLAALGGTFDLIESIGVLHHMKRPVDGMRALAERLRPGGLLRLGLYGERGRAAIVHCRQIIEAEKIGSSADDITRFRHRLIHDPPDGDFANILQRIDFFSTSMCRDFLFHVHEERYTPKRLNHELAAIDLAFIGFEGLEETSQGETGLEETSLKEAYTGMFPDDPAGANLDNWETLEQTWEDPPAGYIFWCQKPGGEESAVK